MSSHTHTKLILPFIITMAKKLNSVCFFPKVANQAYVNWYNSSPIFAVQIPPVKKKIKIEQGKSDFFYDNCFGVCEHYVSEEDIKAQGTRSITDLANYYYSNNKCAGISSPLTTCLKNLRFIDMIEEEVSLHQQMWVFNTNKPSTSVDKFKIYAVNTKVEDDFLLKPYTMANVYQDGGVCWGTNNVVPNNLNVAYNQFYEAPFNKDLVENFQRSIKSTIKNWCPDRSIQEWQSYKEEFFLLPERYIKVYVGSCDGCIVSTDPKLLNVLPTKYKSKSRDGRDIAIGWLKYQEINGEHRWYMNFNGYICMKKTLKPGAVQNSLKIEPLGVVKDFFS